MQLPGYLIRKKIILQVVYKQKLFRMMLLLIWMEPLRIPSLVLRIQKQLSFRTFSEQITNLPISTFYQQVSEAMVPAVLEKTRALVISMLLVLVG